MKMLSLVAALVSLLMATGCSTSKSVASMEGRGARQVFNAGYDPVWNAALVAAEMNDFRILEADKANGYISAKRAMGPTTFGENVGIWVRGIDPATAEVEVVSRRVGPPVSFPRNREQLILKSIGSIVPS